MIWRAFDRPLKRRKCAALAAALFLFGGAVSADTEITLTSVGGGLSVSGPLIGYDGEYIEIASRYGPLTLTYASVECAGTDCPERDGFVPRFSMSGEAAVIDVLIPALWEGFARSKGWATKFDPVEDGQISVAMSPDGDTAAVLELTSGTTTKGFADLFAHRSWSVAATREVTPEELSMASRQGMRDLQSSERSRIIGLDAITPIVSPLRKTRTLSLMQLQRALKGEVSDWADFGEAPGPVELHLGPTDAGTTETVLRFLAEGDVALSVTFHDTEQALTNAVVRNRNAIGLVSFQRTGGARAVGLRDDCGFLTAPTALGIKTEDYPLTTPVFLYVPQRIMPAVFKEFLIWTRSPAAQLIVRRAGFVDQSVLPIGLEAQGQRFANAIERAGTEVSFDELQRFVRLINDQTRLSLSFRFEAGSVNLDAQSRSNLSDLASAIRQGRYAGKTLTLIGFSDGIGDAAANRALSGERAEAVRQSILRRLGDDLPPSVTLEVAAFGEALPMACDDTEIGQRTNRRVELWVED